MTRENAREPVRSVETQLAILDFATRKPSPTPITRHRPSPQNLDTVSKVAPTQVHWGSARQPATACPAMSRHRQRHSGQVRWFQRLRTGEADAPVRMLAAHPDASPALHDATGAIELDTARIAFLERVEITVE